MALLFSILLHAFVFSFDHWPDFSRDLTMKNNHAPLKVTTIDREDWQRLRTVGRKNGSNAFSMPISPKSDRFGKKAVMGEQKRPSAQVDFKQLQVTKDVVAKVRPIEQEKAPAEAKRPKGTIVVREELPREEVRKIEHRHFSQQRPVRLSQAQLSNMPIAVQDAMLLERTDFNIGITPPEGVDFDQLNSAEKMYYSFQKRIFESYVSSFLTSYQNLLVQRPLLKKSLGNSTHQLTGRIVFDDKGNIVSIKIIKSSLSDDVHELFEQTLLNIRSMPNPPKSLLNSEGELSVYYQLIIN